MSWSGICIEKEEISKPSKDGSQNIPDDSISSDLHGSSTMFVSQLPAAISSCNTRSDNDGPISSHWSSVENKMTSAGIDDQESGYIHHPLVGNNVESQKTWLGLQKTTSDIDSRQKEVMPCVAKEKFSSTEHLISIHQSHSKKSCLVDEITYDELKKTTPTAYRLCEFCAVLDEQEYHYVHNSLKGNNGSRPNEKVCKSSTKVVDGKIQGYCSSNKILLVGEGDFSFSACLAKAFGSATNMVATSLNSKAYLRRYYNNAMNNIFELRSRGCKIWHEVHATSMAIHKSFTGLSFNRIIYNFPHCGDFRNTETALRKNQRLVKLFMDNSSKMIEEDGEIHIRHKVNGFFSKWNLGGLASEAGLALIEKVPFDVCEFEGYSTKYGFHLKGDNNFDCHPSSYCPSVKNKN